MNEKNTKLLERHKDILSFRDLEMKTVATYVSYMTGFINWDESELDGKDLNEVTWEEVRAYVRYLKNVKGLNPRTINVHLAQLRDFYYYVLHKDWDRREVPFLHFDEKLPIVPSREEVNAIIDSIVNPKHKAEIALLYSSGMRVNELCGLYCHDIKRAEKNIFIAHGKNRSSRYAILSDKALEVLITYIKTSYRGAKPDDWLFPGQHAGKHISDQSIYNVFKRQLDRLGLGDKGYTLHSLRHAFGLHLYDAGYDLMAIKEALGHKSLSSTQVYVTLGIGNGRIVKSPYDFGDDDTNK